MGPLIIEPVWCVTRPKRSTSTSCRCPATFMPVEALWRWLREDVTYHSAIPPPRISAAGWPLSKHASIRTPSLTDSGSKITSTPTKKNYASQGRRGLADSVYRILAEVGYIADTRSYRLQSVRISAEVMAYLRENDERYVLRCIQVSL